ncbi:hypothetical protein HGM15179_019429 [Zosterops borbonicus]|uniref:Core shell protein Gag P30 domain-containing protein n=1 Tax=Zosterops borbonicus TaxID=364589 RepID=A0A8K1D9S1_9PASS|nr:hypothetical protein HGM15179_019429 [Zosterops borbonicus]
MVDLRNIVIQGIRETMPRGQNIIKVFGECQGRDETPSEWLDRLWKSLQVYSGRDPNSSIEEMLLKTRFVAKLWEDIRRKLEKLENWQEKGLQELVREAQKVYMRRDEEKQKTQAKVLVAAVREVQKQEWVRDPVKPTQNHGAQGKQSAPSGKDSENKREVPEYYYCKKKGHLKRDCRKRMKDEQIFQDD